MRWHEVFGEDAPSGSSGMNSYWLKQFGFRQDNPGGEWLEHQRERAAERGVCGGAITAYFNKDMLVYAKWLHHTQGARNENRKPGEAGFDRLLAKVEAEGFDMAPDNCGLLGIDYAGNGWIIEGNTRAAVAVHLGIDMIPFEVRYFAGGEAIRGDYEPNRVAEFSELNKNNRRQD